MWSKQHMPAHSACEIQVGIIDLENHIEQRATQKSSRSLKHKNHVQDVKEEHSLLSPTLELFPKGQVAFTFFYFFCGTD